MLLFFSLYYPMTHTQKCGYPTLSEIILYHKIIIGAIFSDFVKKYAFMNRHIDIKTLKTIIKTNTTGSKIKSQT